MKCHGTAMLISLHSIAVADAQWRMHDIAFHPPARQQLNQWYIMLHLWP
jgi:hypothetical protein